MPLAASWLICMHSTQRHRVYEKMIVRHGRAVVTPCRFTRSSTLLKKRPNKPAGLTASCVSLFDIPIYDARMGRFLMPHPISTHQALHYLCRQGCTMRCDCISPLDLRRHPNMPLRLALGRQVGSCRHAFSRQACSGKISAVEVAVTCIVLVWGFRLEQRAFR